MTFMTPQPLPPHAFLDQCLEFKRTHPAQSRFLSAFLAGSLDGTQLRLRYGIEVPAFFWPAPPRRLLRISAQLYNTPEQYERLAAALVETTSG